MEGASCTARTDCGGKLACVAEKCVVPGAAANGGNAGGANGGNGSGSSGGDSKSWKGYEGVRPFVGITLGGGPTFLGSSLGSTTQGGFLFALKGGVLIDRIELGAEISPVTFLPYAGSGGKPTLQANIYGGYHIPISGPISWPLRAGIGILAVNTNGLVFFEGRADLIGISALVGPVLLDLHAPSFRIFANDVGYSMHFMFGIGAAILPDAF
jgi:hypothetical protein